MDQLNNSEPPNDEISLKELIQKISESLRYLRSHKWKIVFMVLAGATMGLIYGLNKSTTYTAKLVFVTAESDAGGLGKLGVLGSQFGLDLGSGSSSAFGGDNILELMKSRHLVEQTLLDTFVHQNKRYRMLEYFLLRDSAIKSKIPKVSFEGIIERNTCGFEQDSVLASLYERITKSSLSVSVIDKKLAFKKVEFIDIDPVFAKEFVERLTNKVTSFYLETKTKRSKDNIKILELKADSVEKELQNKMLAAATLKDQSQFLVNTTSMVPSLKRQMEVQLLSTLYGEVVKNLELSKTMSAYNEPLIQIIDKPRFPLEQKKGSKLMGLIIGGFLGGFLAIIWVLGRRFYRGIMA